MGFIGTPVSFVTQRGTTVRAKAASYTGRRWVNLARATGIVDVVARVTDEGRYWRPGAATTTLAMAVGNPQGFTPGLEANVAAQAMSGFYSHLDFLYFVVHGDLQD